MEITVTALSRNALNHPNLAVPVGNLSSPLFGQSTALVSGGGGNSASGNRRIEFQLKLSFYGFAAGVMMRKTSVGAQRQPFWRNLMYRRAGIDPAGCSSRNSSTGCPSSVSRLTGRGQG